MENLSNNRCREKDTPIITLHTSEPEDLSHIRESSLTCSTREGALESPDQNHQDLQNHTNTNSKTKLSKDIKFSEHDVQDKNLAQPNKAQPNPIKLKQEIVESQSKELNVQVLIPIPEEHKSSNPKNTKINSSLTSYQADSTKPRQKRDVMIMCKANELANLFYNDNLIIWYDPNIEQELTAGYLEQLREFRDVKSFKTWQETIQFIQESVKDIQGKKFGLQLIISGQNVEVDIRKSD